LARNSDGFDTISHGYAPDGAAQGGEPQEAPMPLKHILRDVMDQASATAKAEITLLKARGDLAKKGVTTISIWGVAALILLAVALLAFAVGMILALATLIGPLLATLVVTAVLLLLAGLAGLRAKSGVSDMQIALRRDVSGEGDLP
jgi:hypothetical protein